MTTQEIKKLKKVDEIMFNLQDSRDSQKKILQLLNARLFHLTKPL